MEFDDAIENLLDGNAMLFAGAGFSDGAINIRDKPFLKSYELAKYLADKSGITGTVPSLDDTADAFIEMHGEEALIGEIQNEYTSKVITDTHIQLGNLPWKSVYTTNYDDVIEEAYKANSRNIIPITASDDPFRTSKKQALCIHLNGYVHKLNLDTICTELKLAETSYISSELAQSPWATSFRADIRFAQAVFFIGYSLYDLDIKRVLHELTPIKDKCFFILGKSPDETTIRRAKRFGKAYMMPIGEFADYIQKKRRGYIPKKQGDFTISIKEHFPNQTRTKITDQGFSNLLLFGIRNQNMMFESRTTQQPYILFRSKCDVVLQSLEEEQNLIAVCSELGNGKSLFLEALRILALERGYRVFELQENTEESASELEVIARLKGKVLVTIEEYQDWIKEIGILKRISSQNVNIIVTARNVIHDTHFEELQIETRSMHIPEIFLDVLDDSETNWFVESFNHYGLWGDWAARSIEDKKHLIKKICKGQIHALLLKIMESPDIGGRILRLSESIITNKEKYKILIGTCIMTLLNQRPSLDTLVDLFGTKTISSSQFRRDSTVLQFLDFTQNEILLKSPIASQYLLQKVADPALTISILTEMTISADRNASLSKRYRKMFNNFILFSRIQSVLPQSKNLRAIISYYESIKNLSLCKESPLFWLQYAIPCLIMEDLPRCKSYLDTAYSYAIPKNFDTFQLDNFYARYLLVKAIKDLEPDDAMENFREARDIIHQQMREEIIRRHPYRVARFYQNFLDRFYSSLTPMQLIEIYRAADNVIEMIVRLPEERGKHKDIIRCKRSMESIIHKITRKT